MNFTRQARVVSKLEHTLLLSAMKGRESLSQPFEYTLDLLSDSDGIDLSALLGQSVLVELDLANGAVREFNGLVSQFRLLGQHERYVRYQAVLRPWLWLLTQTRNSRIFQNETVPDVVQGIFRRHGFTDFSVALTGKYRTWEYLVQYRESDFNFVQRILEQEGIYYFFKHAEGRHTLVLADSVAAHERAPGYEQVPYFPPQEGERRERDHVDGWLVSRQIRPGVLALRDFDFERPGTLDSASESPRGHAHDHYEVYDYPGEFGSRSDADAQANVQLESLQADFESVQGSGNARGLSAGALFKLEGYPRTDQNRDYLIVETSYELRVGSYESGRSSDANGELDCRCEFVALDSKRQYRPPRRTRKPVVEGPQTAIVVGHEGQEIWTDQYGRVKLAFHWDRLGRADEASSCWVRVSQIWAGSGFGGVHLPRVGQEVIVDFLEGDPDRPIVTGRVYNADNMPPYTLPANQTQSGIKSRSSKGGFPDNFNEIRFEDKKGAEELFIQAEKDQNTNVKNDQSVTVGVNQTETVGANQTATVGANQTVTVGANRTLTVGANETVAVMGARSTTVSQAETQTYQATRTTSVAGTDSLTVGGAHTGTYEGGRSVTVTAHDNTIVNGGNQSTTVHGAYFLDAQSYLVDSKGGMVLNCPSGQISGGPPPPGAPAGGPPNLLTLVATNALVLQCGENSIYIDQQGISIVGKTSVTAQVGDNFVNLASDCATLSGTNATVASSGTTDVMGNRVNLSKAPPKKSVRKL